MDREGNWRLKPQVADTLQRDVQAIMAQTGWERAIARTAQDQNSFQISVSGEVSGGLSAGAGRSDKSKPSGAAFGQTAGSLGVSSQEAGSTSEIASAQLNIVNFDVRQALANAERSAARTTNPAEAFSSHLATEILGPNGLRNRYLDDGDSGRGTVDLTAPVTSLEQSSLLTSGKFSTDLKNGPFDGDRSFKKSDGGE